MSNRGSTPWRAECGENRGGEQELQACREPARAVPALVVEEFPSTRAQDGEDVLEVGRGARRSAKCCRIERSSPCGEEKDARKTAANLEPTRVEVSVRNPVARNVDNRPQKQRREPRAAGGAGRSACRDVEGNYHSRLTSGPRAGADARQDGGRGHSPRASAPNRSWSMGCTSASA